VIDQYILTIPAVTEEIPSPAMIPTTYNPSVQESSVTIDEMSHSVTCTQNDTIVNASSLISNESTTSLSVDNHAITGGHEISIVTTDKELKNKGT